MKLISRMIIALSGLMVTGTALAHPGHGEEGSLAHFVVHVSWGIAGAILLSSVALHFWRRRGAHGIEQSVRTGKKKCS